MYRLVIEDDEGHTTPVPLIRDEFTIGRREGNTIRLTQRNVSRRHARVFRQEEVFFVEDLGSFNGVRLNGERIRERCPLHDGDIVQIGDYHLMIQRDRAAAKAAPATAANEAPAVIPVRGQVKTDPLHALAEGSAQGANESPPAAASSAPAVAARFTVLTPALGVRELTVERDGTTIGSEADVSLAHRSLAKAHARVALEAGVVTLHDLGGGLRVNGEAYSARALKEGDLVELGGVKLRFAGRVASPRPALVAPEPASDLVTTLPMRPSAALGSPAATKAAAAADLDSELATLDAPKAPASAAVVAEPDEGAEPRKSKAWLFGLVGAVAVGVAVYFLFIKARAPAPAAPSPAPSVAAPKAEASDGEDEPAPRPRRKAPRELGALPAERPPARPKEPEVPPPAPKESLVASAPAAPERPSSDPFGEAPPSPKAAESIVTPAPPPPVAAEPEPEDPPSPPPPSVATMLEPKRAPTSPAPEKSNLERAKELVREGTSVLLRSPPRAVGVLLRAIKLAPRYAKAHKQLGIAYNAIGNDFAAARHFRRYLALRPNAGDADEVRSLLAEAERAAKGGH